jgi:CheY-like chemotaxis protein
VPWQPVPREKTAVVGARIKRILLVEDTPDNRLLVTAYLRKLPLVLDEADNGEAAVELFRRNNYDLVLMDVQMPVMDGHEATRRIRAFEAEQRRQPVPIIALTAHAIKEEIDKCMVAGCDAHLSKPIKKSVLIETLHKYLNLGLEC